MHSEDRNTRGDLQDDEIEITNNYGCNYLFNFQPNQGVIFCDVLSFTAKTQRRKVLKLNKNAFASLRLSGEIKILRNTSLG